MGRLEGKIALVTGAGKLRGIGSVSAEAMAREGAKVVIADLKASTVAATAQHLRDQGLEVSHAFVDLLDEASIAAMVENVVAEHGRIDVLLNNVAVTATSPGFEATGSSDLDILTMDRDIWRKTLDINVTGVALTIKHVLPVMIAHGGGSIINTSSTAAYRFHANLSAYQTSKAAIEAITRIVAASYGKQGIRCNAIAPGLTTSSNVEMLITPERMEIDREFSLTPDIAEPEDQAAAAVFLASDESRRTTGHTIFVDGGITVQMPYVPVIRKMENAGMNRTDGG